MTTNGRAAVFFQIEYEVVYTMMFVLCWYPRSRWGRKGRRRELRNDGEEDGD